MEDFIWLITIAYILGAILGIILFFKIWGMTNDVKEIRKRMKFENNWPSKAYLKGDMEAVRKLLLDEFIDRIADSEHFTVSYEKILDTIKEFEPLFKKYGIDIPENVKNIQGNTLNPGLHVRVP